MRKITGDPDMPSGRPFVGSLEAERAFFPRSAYGRGPANDMSVQRERLLQRDREGLVPERVRELDPHRRFRLAPAVFAEPRVRNVPVRCAAPGVKVEGEPDARVVDDDRILVGLVAREPRDGGVVVVAFLLPGLPHLLDRHLLLVDLVDDRAGVLFLRQSGLFHPAAVAVVEDREVENVLGRLLVDPPRRVLRPRPVEAAFALRVFALDLVALGVNRRQDLFREALLPTFGRAQDPLHLLVASDLDDGRLVARRNDDRVVRRVVVDGVDAEPVAAHARPHDVAEVVRLVELREVEGRERLTGLRSIDVEAHGTLVQHLDYGVAVGVENVEELPFVHDAAVLVDLNHNATCNRRRLIDTGIYTYRNSDHCKAYRKWEKIPYGVGR